MLLDQITPLILSYNEAANIGRSLERLTWANQVVVVDSYSEDETTSIAKSFSNVRLIQRRFDTHTNQWNYGLQETGIQTEWVLALDADYILPLDFVQEIGSLNPATDVVGYKASFRYCIRGRPIRGSLYPPVTVLYRRRNARYVQDGHTQRLIYSGNHLFLRSTIDHDDRKSFQHWLKAQYRYCGLEAAKLKQAASSDLSWPDKIRKRVYFAPVLVPLYCLFVKGNILDGSAGLHYAQQRAISELLLSLFLMEPAPGTLSNQNPSR